METKEKKVLLIKLSSLGDVIFNIPLANCLKQAGYQVDWLVSEKGLDVLNGNPCLDNLIVAPFVKWNKTKGIKALLANIKEYLGLVKKIREKKYDIVIDTQGRLKSLMFTITSGAKRRLIGTDSQELSFLGANEFVKVPKKNSQIMNITEKYLLFAKYLNISTEKAEMSLPISSEETKNRLNNIMIISDERPLIVLSPTTTWVTKHWDKENWKDLVNRLSGEYNLIFTGMNSDNDYIEYIRNEFGTNLAGKTDLKMLIELFRRASLVVSLDSGSTHLARAAKASAIVAIFCSTPATMYEPLGEKYISLQGKLSCQPCHKRKCKNKDNKCTKLPEVSEVYNAIKELLR